MSSRKAMQWSRGRYPHLAALAAAIAIAVVSVQADAFLRDPGQDAEGPPTSAETSTFIVTIGTGGGPRPSAKRGQPASVVKVANRVYLVDAGPGVSHKLAAAQIRAKNIDKIFLTHLHFDHSGGLNSLLGAAWVEDATRKVEVYGPPATSVFVQAGVQYLTMTLNLYAAQRAPTPSVSELVKTHDVDITEPTLIYRDDSVRVSAVDNSHFVTLPADRRPVGAARSYAYRFDTPDRSIVFTGDTGPSDALVALAEGADVLVSMVHDLDQVLASLNYDGKDERQKPLVDHYRHELLSARDVGRLAAKAGVKMVILSHLSERDDTETGRSRILDGVHAEFSGKVIIASDGSEF